MDRSRGVTLPCLPWDLLQQLLLNRQAAGDKDLQAGGCPEQAMQQQERGQGQRHCLLVLFLCHKPPRGKCRINASGVQGVTLQQCCCWQSEPCVPVSLPCAVSHQVCRHSFPRQKEQWCP